MMAKMPEAVSIFLMPPEPCMETLRQRLVNRGTETEERISRRLKIAEREMTEAHLFNRVIVSGLLEEAKRDFVAYLTESIGKS